ncbi:conserved exported hypothetical protein [Gammaproteobacteria bacterium]
MTRLHPLLLAGVLLGMIAAGRSGAGAEPSASAMIPQGRWVAWYAIDGRIHRQWVKVDAYEELRAALHQVQEEDRQRLTGLAAEYLRIELQSVLDDLNGRREPFLFTLFDFGTSSALLGTALSTAEQARAAGQDGTVAVDAIREAVSEEVIQKTRAQLLIPENTLRAIRAAASRVLSRLRQDLLQDCDRYDRAFQGFVLESATVMESLDTTAGWQVDLAGRPETATFRSLCEGVRHSDPGAYLVESAMAASFTNAENSLRPYSLELVRTLAETSLEVAHYTEDKAASFSSWGWPQNWSHGPAAVVSYFAYTKVFARRVAERLDVRRWRPYFRGVVQKMLEDLEADLIQRLKGTCDEFISSEMGRIELGLAARGEGAWSTP